MASVICCPLCRAPLPQDYEISSVPTNFNINRLIEIFGKRKEAGESSALKEIKCSNCENGSEAVTWCIDCEDSLCDHCNDAHQRVKVSKCHKRVAIDEFVKNPKLVYVE